MDGQTDRILVTRPRLHSMQRGKNEIVAPTLTSHATYIIYNRDGKGGKRRGGRGPGVEGEGLGREGRVRWGLGKGIR